MSVEAKGTAREYTVDPIGRGALELEQPRRGYRFNIDAILLAAFTAEHARRVEHVVDLGAGCGVVGLLMARHWPEATVMLVELQGELAALCAQNIRRNGLGRRARVLQMDLREGGWGVAEGGCVAVCNPPFFVVGHGRVSQGQQAAIARHELHLTLEQLIGAAAADLRPRHEISLVHLAQRREELFRALAAANFGNIRFRLTRALPRREPSRILVVATRGDARKDRLDLGDLIINDAGGGYSAEVRALLEPGVEMSDEG